MENTLKNARLLADAVLSLTREGDLERAVTHARRLNKSKLYVPCSFNAVEAVSLFTNPESLVLVAGNSGSEPVYGSFEHALFGRNEDNTPHSGFLVLDSTRTLKPSEKYDLYVCNLIDREKDTIMPHLFLKDWYDGIISDLKNDFKL